MSRLSPRKVPVPDIGGEFGLQWCPRSVLVFPSTRTGTAIAVCLAAPVSAMKPSSEGLDAQLSRPARADCATSPGRVYAVPLDKEANRLTPQGGLLEFSA